MSLGVFLVASAVAACSSFGTTSGAPGGTLPTPDAEANDGGADGAGSADAGADSRFSCDANFCRDFDSVSRPEQNWPQFEVTEDGRGKIALFDDPTAPSRPNVFASSLVGPDASFGAARLSFQKEGVWLASGTTKLSIETELLVAATDGKDVGFLNFEVGANDKRSTALDAGDPTFPCYETVVLSAEVTDKTWVPTLRLISPCSGFTPVEPPKKFESVAIPVDTWVHIRVDLNPRVPNATGRAEVVLSLTLAGNATTVKFTTLVGLPRNLRVDFGLSGYSVDARARYDNIQVSY